MWLVFYFYFLLKCLSYHLYFLFAAEPAVLWLLMTNRHHPQWSGPQIPPPPCLWVLPTWLILNHCHPSRMSPLSAQHTAHLSTYFASVTEVSISSACIEFLKCFVFPFAKRLELFFMEVRGSNHSPVRSGDRNGLSGLMPATSELNITHTVHSISHFKVTCFVNGEKMTVLKIC